MELQVGDRVRFLGFKVHDLYSLPYSLLEVGEEGTVKSIIICYPNLPVQVQWDTHGLLGMRWDEVESI